MQINERLNEHIQWHDSKLLSLNLRQEKNPMMPPTFIVTMTVAAILLSVSNDAKQHVKQITFSNCWAFGTNLDLLYIANCGGSISRAQSVSRFVEFDNDTQSSIKKWLGLSQNQTDGTGNFFFELIEPGGIILIGAENYTMSDD